MTLSSLSPTVMFYHVNTAARASTDDSPSSSIVGWILKLIDWRRKGVFGTHDRRLNGHIPNN
ncbi:hypothetical protein, partial [Escherichia coli]|uniref:hypothetical protein n=1 Tax=Escherichia coli TaxID=562 RepID=UPI001BFC3EAB